MPNLEDVAAWMDALEGEVTIQRTATGWMMILKSGGTTVMARRESFKDAAFECIMAAQVGASRTVKV